MEKTHVEENSTPHSMDLDSGDVSESDSNVASTYTMLPDYPIQLVRPDTVHHRHLEIVESNVKYLHHIDSAVAIVAVVGKYHSGKSFLLNQLMRRQQGFGIGPTVRPETMGIWMWGRVSKILSHTESLLCILTGWKMFFRCSVAVVMIG